MISTRRPTQLLALVEVLPNSINNPVVELDPRNNFRIDGLGLDLLLRREGLAEGIGLRGTCTIAKLCTTRVDGVTVT